MDIKRFFISIILVILLLGFVVIAYFFIRFILNIILNIFRK